MKKTAYILIAAVVLISFLFVGAIGISHPSSVVYGLELDETERTALGFLNEIKDDYGIIDAQDEFMLENVLQSPFGEVYRLVQRKNGYRVYARGINISVNKSGKITSVNSTYKRIERVRPERIGQKEAEQIAERYGEILSVEKVIYSFDGLESYPTYAYDIKTPGSHAIVSASDGNVLLSAATSASAAILSKQTDYFGKQVDTYLERENNNYILADYTRNIIAIDMKNTSQKVQDPYTSRTETFSDGVAISAYNNVVKAYDFYANPANIGVARFGLNDKNDNVSNNFSNPFNDEIKIYVLVHFDNKWENALYTTINDKTAAIYVGDGNINSKIYNPGVATDVIAHEYQHGITEHIAHLEYLNESGAIDEAISDIFGMLVEGKELSNEKAWYIGENAVGSGAVDGMIRNTISPDMSSRSLLKLNAQDKYPLCNNSHNHANYGCDYGGVHSNNTILTHMQYNIYKDNPDFFTRQTIGKLWYSTLLKLSQQATFVEFGECMLSSATELGFPEEIIESIEANLYKSGITAPSGAHLVKFVNPDGSIIDEFSVPHGGEVTPPADPFYPYRGDATKKHVLSGWNSELTNITSDKTITASYKTTERKYTVRFADEDGNVYKKEEVAYGTVVTPPDDIINRPSDDLYDYEFAGWGSEEITVTEDAEIRAEFNAVRCYKVRFYVDSAIYEEQRIREGGNAHEPEVPPTKESDEQYTYTFSHWVGAYTNVMSDLAIMAVFDKEYVMYDVIFMSENSQLTSYSTPYGSGLVMPSVPKRTGYNFVGWYYDEEFTQAADDGDAINGETVLYAKWEATETSGNGDENGGDDNKKGCAGCATVDFGGGNFPFGMIGILAIGFLALLPLKRRCK